ncbi:MAG: NBR1-Ig-like domain-containing protein [Anaerolineales bacterium]
MRKISLLLLLLPFLLACSLTEFVMPYPDNPTLVPAFTAAAQTIQAMSTSLALTASATPWIVTPSPIVTPTPIPTNTFIPTATVPILPTFVLPPAATSTPNIPCNAAQFIADVNFPDPPNGPILSRGATFTKIWKIKNVGRCTWTTDYDVVWVGGDRLNAPKTTPLPNPVAPGETVNIAVTMQAPSTDGDYRAYFMLRNAQGTLFGLGRAADKPFWAWIRVSGPSNLVYDFTANMCAATWKNGSATLPCPGVEGNTAGYVLLVPTPRMENGRTEDEPGLLVAPQAIQNGIIKGEFPPIRIRSGDRFKALIFCAYQATNCNVKFRLAYRIGNGALQTLGEWNEANEGLYTSLDLDLSALDGKDVKFVLILLANGSPNGDRAIWLHPHILRVGTPTPTFTPTPTNTPTFTPTPTSTFTPTPTDTPTFTPTPSDTPTPTP